MTSNSRSNVCAKYENLFQQISNLIVKNRVEKNLLCNLEKTLRRHFHCFRHKINLYLAKFNLNNFLRTEIFFTRLIFFGAFAEN
jgi:hypothetical protein